MRAVEPRPPQPALHRLEQPLAHLLQRRGVVLGDERPHLVVSEVGLVDSVEVAADMVGIQKVFEPNSADSQTYAELYPIYLAAYWGLQEPFKEIAAYQRSRELLV